MKSIDDLTAAKKQRQSLYDTYTRAQVVADQARADWLNQCAAVNTLMQDLDKQTDADAGTTPGSDGAGHGKKP